MATPPYQRILTRFQMERRLFILVGGLAAIHFFVDAAQPYLPLAAITGIRVAAGLAAGLGTASFEIVKMRRVAS